MNYGSVLFKTWPSDSQHAQHQDLETEIWIVLFTPLLFLLTWKRLKKKLNRQRLTSQSVCSQPYFRLSRASAWGCDSEGASRPLPHNPIPPPCLDSLHLYTPNLLQRPRARASVPADLRERSFPDHCLHWPLFWTSLPLISVYIVAVCGTDSFSMDSLKKHAGWRTCVSLLTWHLCVWRCKTVDVRLHAACDSCW